MKKLMALVLALLLALSLGSGAFAATTVTKDAYMDSHYENDHTMEWEPETMATTVILRPGETYKLDVYAVEGGQLPLSSKNWKIETKWTKGGALVDSVTFNKDEGTMDLKLKENFTITDAKGLEGEITLVGKGDYKGTNYVIKLDYSNTYFKSWASVANNTVTVYGEEDPDDCVAQDADNNTLYICDEDTPGYVKFNSNALLGCTLNMVGKEKAFMYTDESTIEELAEKFPEADIECYNFGGQPTFKNAAKFTLQADYADKYYIYSYTNGKLAAQEAEWDSVEGVYTWETKTPTSYVISDVELVAAAADDAAVKNPDTGANDVVGAAAALAVVSLLAAGAVSLKK